MLDAVFARAVELAPLIEGGDDPLEARPYQRSISGSVVVPSDAMRSVPVATMIAGSVTIVLPSRPRISTSGGCT